MVAEKKLLVWLVNNKWLVLFVLRIDWKYDTLSAKYYYAPKVKSIKWEDKSNVRTIHLNCTHLIHIPEYKWFINAIERYYVHLDFGVSYLQCKCCKRMYLIYISRLPNQIDGFYGPLSGSLCTIQCIVEWPIQLIQFNFQYVTEMCAFSNWTI